MLRSGHGRLQHRQVALLAREVQLSGERRALALQLLARVRSLVALPHQHLLLLVAPFELLLPGRGNGRHRRHFRLFGAQLSSQVRVVSAEFVRLRWTGGPVAATTIAR